MVSYKERLAAALRFASATDAQLAAHLDVSIQAVRKVAAGTTVAFTAANNSKAAKFLGVDPDWLATGDGEMQAEMKWPFTQVTPEQFQTLAVEARIAVENFTLFHLGLESLSPDSQLSVRQNGPTSPSGKAVQWVHEDGDERRGEHSPVKAKPADKRRVGKNT